MHFSLETEVLPGGENAQRDGFNRSLGYLQLTIMRLAGRAIDCLI